MATNRYSFNIPTVNGNSGTWGGLLNDNWEKVDNLLYGESYTDTNSVTVERIRPDLEEGSWQINGTAVTATAANLNSISGLTSTASELNLLDTAVANTVVNGKAVIYGTAGQVAATTLSASSSITTATANITTGNITTVDFGDWTITESAGVLYFATGGTNKMKLDASGNLTVVGNVTAYGTV